MGHRKQDDDTGVSEMKAFGEELIATGARYIEAGKRWLDARLDDSTSQRRAREQDGGRPRRGREHDPYRRGRGDHGPDRSAWSGGGASRSGLHEHDEHGTGHGHAFWDEPPHGSEPEPGAGPWRHEQRWPPREPHPAGGDGYGAYGSERLRGSDDHLSDWGHRARPGHGSGRHGGHGRHTDAARHGNAAGWRGVGPKGYVRSDARITEDICERLLYDDAIDAREISVQVRNGVVSLEGHVPGRAMKHRVEDLVERCAGVRDIENHLRVQRAGGPGQHDAPHGDSLHTGTPGAHDAPDTNVARSPSDQASPAPSLTGSATGLNAPGAAAASGNVSASGSDNGGDAPDDDGNPHRL